MSDDDMARQAEAGRRLALALLAEVNREPLPSLETLEALQRIGEAVQAPADLSGFGAHLPEPWELDAARAPHDDEESQ